MGFVEVDAQMMELHLGLRPGQRQRALKVVASAILVGKFEHLLAAWRPPWWKKQCAPWCRAECARCAAGSTTGSSTEPTVLESGRAVDNRNGIAHFVAASDEPRAVRFVLQVADGFAFDGDHVRGPNGVSSSDCLRRVASSAPDLGDKFGLHEQIGKRRMGCVGGLECQAYLGIRSDLNFPRAHARDS